jgi:predicted nucleic acid-binding protein
MAGLYVDTSALGRVMLAEPDAQLIRDTMAQYEALWSSTLLQLELRRLARREGVEDHADELLLAVRTRRLDSESLRRAAELEPAEVRALDAIHLDAAIQLRKRGAIDAVLTFDQQLQTGCAHHGLAVEAPVPS